MSTLGASVNVTAKSPAIGATTVVNNSLIIVSCTVAIVLITRLLSHIARRSPRLLVKPPLAPSMHFYLVGHLFGCATTLPYYCYIALQWVGVTGCSPMLLFLFLQLRYIYGLYSTVPITVLALDRCLTIRLGESWTARMRRWLVVAGYAATALMTGVLLAFITTGSGPAPPVNSTNVCPAAITSAAQTDYKLRLKYVLEAMDLSSSLWLLYLLRKYHVGWICLHCCWYHAQPPSSEQQTGAEQRQPCGEEQAGAPIGRAGDGVQRATAVPGHHGERLDAHHLAGTDRSHGYLCERRSLQPLL